MKITRQQMNKILELCEADPQVAYLEWLRYADPKEQLKDALKNCIREQTKMACLGGKYVQMLDEDSEVIASYCYSGGPLTNEKTAIGLLIFIDKYFSEELYWALDIWESEKMRYEMKPWYFKTFCSLSPKPDSVNITVKELCELYYDFFTKKDAMVQEVLEGARNVLKKEARQTNQQYLNTKGVCHE